jgi:hypothetical protein
VSLLINKYKYIKLKNIIIILNKLKKKKGKGVAAGWAATPSP